jgi:hypothetical protein
MVILSDPGGFERRPAQPIWQSAFTSRAKPVRLLPYHRPAYHLHQGRGCHRTGGPGGCGHHAVVLLARGHRRRGPRRRCADRGLRRLHHGRRPLHPRHQSQLARVAGGQAGGTEGDGQHRRGQHGDRRQPRAARRDRSQRAGPLRSRCAEPARREMGDGARRHQRYRPWGPHARGNGNGGRTHRRPQADHRAGAHARPQGDWLHADALEGAYYSRENGEAVREALNTWIRTSGAYDAVVDFEAATRDPNNPKRFRADLDPGDHLHPNDAGYQAMATPSIFPSSAANGPRPSRPNGERANPEARPAARAGQDQSRSPRARQAPRRLPRAAHHLSDHFAGGYHRHRLHARRKDGHRGGRQPRHSRQPGRARGPHGARGHARHRARRDADRETYSHGRGAGRRIVGCRGGPVGAAGSGGARGGSAGIVRAGGAARQRRSVLPAGRPGGGDWPRKRAVSASRRAGARGPAGGSRGACFDRRGISPAEPPFDKRISTK